MPEAASAEPPETAADGKEKSTNGALPPPSQTALERELFVSLLRATVGECLGAGSDGSRIAPPGGYAALFDRELEQVHKDVARAVHLLPPDAACVVAPRPWPSGDAAAGGVSSSLDLPVFLFVERTIARAGLGAAFLNDVCRLLFYWLFAVAASGAPLRYTQGFHLVAAAVLSQHSEEEGAAGAAEAAARQAAGVGEQPGVVALAESGGGEEPGDDAGGGGAAASTLGAAACSRGAAPSGDAEPAASASSDCEAVAVVAAADCGGGCQTGAAHGAVADGGEPGALRGGWGGRERGRFPGEEGRIDSRGSCAASSGDGARGDCRAAGSEASSAGSGAGAAVASSSPLPRDLPQRQPPRAPREQAESTTSADAAGSLATFPGDPAAEKARPAAADAHPAAAAALSAPFARLLRISATQLGAVLAEPLESSAVTQLRLVAGILLRYRTPVFSLLALDSVLRAAGRLPAAPPAPRHPLHAYLVPLAYVSGLELVFALPWLVTLFASAPRAELPRVAELWAELRDAGAPFLLFFAAGLLQAGGCVRALAAAAGARGVRMPPAYAAAAGADSAACEGEGAAAAGAACEWIDFDQLVGGLGDAGGAAAGGAGGGGDFDAAGDAKRAAFCGNDLPVAAGAAAGAAAGDACGAAGSAGAAAASFAAGSAGANFSWLYRGFQFCRAHFASSEAATTAAEFGRVASQHGLGAGAAAAARDFARRTLRRPGVAAEWAEICAAVAAAPGAHLPPESIFRRLDARWPGRGEVVVYGKGPGGGAGGAGAGADGGPGGSTGGASGAEGGASTDGGRGTGGGTGSDGGCGAAGDVPGTFDTDEDSSAASGVEGSAEGSGGNSADAGNGASAQSGVPSSGGLSGAGSANAARRDIADKKKSLRKKGVSAVPQRSSCGDISSGRSVAAVGGPEGADGATGVENSADKTERLSFDGGSAGGGNRGANASLVGVDAASPRSAEVGKYAGLSADASGCRGFASGSGTPGATGSAGAAGAAPGGNELAGAPRPPRTTIDALLHRVGVDASADGDALARRIAAENRELQRALQRPRPAPRGALADLMRGMRWRQLMHEVLDLLLLRRDAEDLAVWAAVARIAGGPGLLRG